MHIYFIGIGGTAIGPLALIAHQNGYTVSGSDKQDSQYIAYLKKHGLSSINIGNDPEFIEKTHAKTPITWVVHSSAVTIENPNNLELAFAKKHSIAVSKRDELLNKILKDSGKKLVAIAGTHGKTTTTAMTIWLFKQLGLPISYSVGAKISFGDMGAFDPKSEYFAYECDEFDYNFLAFHPYVSLITGVDYDHHEIFPTRESYRQAFRQFISQSEKNILWQSDIASNSLTTKQSDTILNDDDEMLNTLRITGNVNRRNAWQVINCLHQLTGEPLTKLIPLIESFPGLSRRFEKITEGLYSDYAHTPPKIAGCLQLASEVSDRVVVVYEPLTDRRQHHIKETYRTLFKGIKKLYWVPSYLAREDPSVPILAPAELIEEMDNKEIAEPAAMDAKLAGHIKDHTHAGDTVVCLSGGGGGSLDEWVRANFRSP